MKAQGSGYILNVSSYFGGEKYIAVPYPNRSDYAVSKAGQRALVENLARFVGPEIQINAIAPGPVEGQRLEGQGRQGRPVRPSREADPREQAAEPLHGAVLKALEAGATLDDVLERARAERRRPARARGDAPRRCARSRTKISQGSGQERGRRGDVLVGALRDDPAMATRLVTRLRNGCVILEDADQAKAEAWAEALPEPPSRSSTPTTSRPRREDPHRRARHAAPARMPTETDVALATVFFMADRAISGETFEPSGGLQQERTITERELFGRAKPERVRRMEGETIWLIGEHMAEPLAAAARSCSSPRATSARS
jgi:malonyl-CoA reductase / 3-hydroxypropionate dehydrogenase (NADP+)